MMMGWRITALETRAKELERRLEVRNDRFVALVEQVVALQHVEDQQSSRLASIEKRVGEVEWRGMSERLVRLESSADQARLILNAIGLAVIAQIIGTIWRAVIDRKNGNGNGRVNGKKA
jgi:uncharacterized coiled-coil protein SlyX